MAWQNNAYYPQYQFAPQNGAVPDVLNQYKGNYQVPVVNIPPVQTDMLWVLNETEATSYPVAPGNNVILWDKNQNTVYIKSVSVQGVPSIRILDYTERTENAHNRPESHECKCKDKFVPIETYNALVAQIDVLRAKVESIAAQIKPKKNKEDTDNAE